MSKTRKQVDTFRKIKKVPSDHKRRNETNDDVYDVRFNHIPANIQVPVYR